MIPHPLWPLGHLHIRGIFFVAQPRRSIDIAMHYWTLHEKHICEDMDPVVPLRTCGRRDDSEVVDIGWVILFMC